LAVGQAIEEIVPIFFVKGFIDPVFERSIVINSHFRDIRKKEAKILHDKVFVLKEGTSNTANIVTARSHHLLGRAIVRATHCFPKEIKLASGNHVTDAGNVIKHPPHMFIV
jgi:hypothetical protein